MEFIIDALGISAVLAIFIVVFAAAIIYAVIKKKKDSDYTETGIPKMVDKPERTEGSSEAASEPAEQFTYDSTVLSSKDEPKE